MNKSRTNSDSAPKIGESEVKKLILTLATAAISLCSSLALAQAEPTPLARCTLEGQFLSMSPVYLEIFGLAGTKQFVRTTLNGNLIEVPASNIMPTWISFRSTFTFEGRKLRIDFSNYISPSIGQLMVDDIHHEPIACELPSRKSQVQNPNPSENPCFEECGRSCQDQPVFCGQW